MWIAIAIFSALSTGAVLGYGTACLMYAARDRDREYQEYEAAVQKRLDEITKGEVA